MDRSGVETAAKLLAKAQSTDWDDESIALVEKAYQLLAGVITRAEDEAGSSPTAQRRRERRYRRDRRVGRRSTMAAPAMFAPDPGLAYRRLAEGLRPQASGAVNVTA